MRWKERYTMAHRSFWKNRNMEKVQEIMTVSYTHLRAHETGRNLVCRLLLEKKKNKMQKKEKKL